MTYVIKHMTYVIFKYLFPSYAALDEYSAAIAPCEALSNRCSDIESFGKTISERRQLRQGE